MSTLYIGLMSGTSIDGIDVALVDFADNDAPKLLDCQTVPYEKSLQEQLHKLCSQSENEVINVGKTDRKLAEAFAAAVQQMLEKHALNAADIKAIGSHGQTIRHVPAGAYGFSVQIGDPNTIAVLTGIDVVADFRRKDIALGGQGAPLVPAFHKAVFQDHQHHRAVVNIGGIANITLLPADNSSILGFDTGPGNTLMDAWCKRHTGKAYDKEGAWAATGNVNPLLLKGLLAHPYFKEKPPKSTGREMFHLNWLEQLLATQPDDIKPEDVQATLLALTAQSISQHILSLSQVSEVFICGGGAFNPVLLDAIKNEMPGITLTCTDSLNIAADAVEAMAFAWLAYAHIKGLPGNIPDVTGACRPAVLGGLYPAQ